MVFIFTDLFQCVILQHEYEDVFVCMSASEVFKFMFGEKMYLSFGDRPYHWWNHFLNLTYRANTISAVIHWSSFFKTIFALVAKKKFTDVF